MTLRTPALAVAVACSILVAPLALAGPPATDFSLRDLDGKAVALSDFEGKVIFVDFWATWCGPCKDAMPHWQRMYDDLKDDGLVVLAVSTDDARSRPQIKPFIKRSGYTYPVLLDSDSSALVVYNPNKTLPFSVLIDRDFTVHNVHAGYTPGDEKAIRAEIEALLAPPPPETPSPAPVE